MNKIERLQELIDKSQNIVFFGGAGVSTESGIPDFRSVDGLYNQKWDYPPETILSAPFFRHDPKEFYRFYKEKILIPGIKPNAAHIKLAQLEEAGKLKAVITQNIDGLHQAAGSKNVFELHGSTLRNYCTQCQKFYTGTEVNKMLESNPTPVCTECGSLIKPDVVLYEESLKDETVDGAINALSQADLLIIGGTSLTVYPAAGLVHYYRGKNIVSINKSRTPGDSYATLSIHDSIGKILDQIRI